MIERMACVRVSTHRNTHTHTRTHTQRTEFDRPTAGSDLLMREQKDRAATLHSSLYQSFCRHPINIHPWAWHQKVLLRSKTSAVQSVSPTGGCSKAAIWKPTFNNQTVKNYYFYCSFDKGSSATFMKQASQSALIHVYLIVNLAHVHTAECKHNTTIRLYKYL